MLLNLDRIVGAKPEFVPQVEYIPDAPAPKPQILEQTEIPYPTIGLIKPEGTVRLRLRIGVNGRPTEVAVGTSSGYVALHRAAIKAVAHWRFKPRMLDGNLVESWVEMPIVFRLRN